MAGEWTGTGTISCSAEFACRIASQMLMAEYAVVDADVLDAVAEIANMILGNVKTALEKSLGPMGMSIPDGNFWQELSGQELWRRNLDRSSVRLRGANPGSQVVFKAGSNAAVVRYKNGECTVLPAGVTEAELHRRNRRQGQG